VKILHLMSQTHLTGPEVYVAGLCRKQMADGHECLVVSDTLSVPTDARYIPMAIHDRSTLNRLRNIFRLTALCRREGVDLIHAHSRASSWVANVVSRLSRVAYVSTIHGRQSARAVRSNLNIYGRHIIVVCEHLQAQVYDELNIRDADVTVIRNGFD
jgi:glycosyltransferase involved in cell wall biosynthesis